eukprot:SAG31_NODE_7198_length_1759_cov_1.236747_2_plen_98_part_00
MLDAFFTRTSASLLLWILVSMPEYAMCRLFSWLEQRVQSKGGELALDSLAADMGNPSLGGGPELVAAAKAVTSCSTVTSSILSLVAQIPRLVSEEVE